MVSLQSSLYFELSPGGVKVSPYVTVVKTGIKVVNQLCLFDADENIRVINRFNYIMDLYVKEVQKLA